MKRGDIKYYISDLASVKERTTSYIFEKAIHQNINRLEGEITGFFFLCFLLAH